MDFLDELLAGGSNSPNKEAPLVELVEQEEAETHTSESQETVDSTGKGGPWHQHLVSDTKDKVAVPRDNEFWDTKIQDKIHPDNLVWARNHYYSNKSAKTKGKFSNWTTFMPARVCDNSEGMYVELNGQWPIPDNLRLIEFINAPKEHPKIPEKFLVEASDIIPFHENVNRCRLSPANSPASSPGRKSKFLVNATSVSAGSKMMKTQVQTMLNFSNKSKKGSLRSWNVNGFMNLQHLLGHCGHYTSDQAAEMEKGILRKAENYLTRSLQHADQIEKNKVALFKQRQEEEEQDARDVAARKGNGKGKGKGDDSAGSDGKEEQLDITKFARKDLSGESKLKLVKDMWISYTHKIFKKTMYTRIVEVTKDKKRRLIVENGEVLGPNYQVRLLETLPDGTYNGDSSTGSSYKALREFKYKSGRSTKLTTIHEKAMVRASGNKIKLGGNGAGAAGGNGSGSESGSGSDGSGSLSDSDGNGDGDSDAGEEEVGKLEEGGKSSTAAAAGKKRGAANMSTSSSVSSIPSSPSPQKRSKETKLVSTSTSSNLSNSDSDSDDYDLFA